MLQNLLDRQRKDLRDRKERYENGLLKLADTEEQVVRMQNELEELQPKLEEATTATDALLAQISRDTEVANEKKALVEKEASAFLPLTRIGSARDNTCEAGKLPFRQASYILC